MMQVGQGFVTVVALLLTFASAAILFMSYWVCYTPTSQKDEENPHDSQPPEWRLQVLELQESQPRESELQETSVDIDTESQDMEHQEPELQNTKLQDTGQKKGSGMNN